VSPGRCQSPEPIADLLGPIDRTGAAGGLAAGHGSANPLVRRVAVNRLWHYHFGTELVATTSDSASMATAVGIPSCSTGWPVNCSSGGGRSSNCNARSCSATLYQQSCALNEALDHQIEERLLWRMNRRRLKGKRYATPSWR